MENDLVSNIKEVWLPDTPMYKAALKKENNRIAREWNALFKQELLSITPLTDEEEVLCNQFEEFVKSTRE